jgi:hypothetical protein
VTPAGTTNGVSVQGAVEELRRGVGSGVPDVVGVSEGVDVRLTCDGDAVSDTGVSVALGVPDEELLGTAHQFHTGMPPSPPVKV